MVALSSVLLAPFSGHGAAPAPATAGESARAHHDKARAAVRQGDFEAAIGDYRRAYELKADPSYLLDIADAYQRLGVAERAVFFYRRYLSTHGDPPNRPEIEAQIARLEPNPPPPVPRPEALVPAVTPLPFDVPPRTVSERERSVVGRWWFWTAVGALAAAGATVAILAATRDAGDDIPRTSLGNARVEF